MQKRSTSSGSSPQVVVKRSSAGLGLFALHEIEKGAVVIEYVGKRLSKEEEEKSNSKYLFEVSSRVTLDGKPRWNPAGYINHSCRPNCEPHVRMGRVYIDALRRIKEGEELTYDYGKEYFNVHIRPFGCRCVKCAKR